MSHFILLSHLPISRQSVHHSTIINPIRFSTKLKHAAVINYARSTSPVYLYSVFDKALNRSTQLSCRRWVESRARLLSPNHASMPDSVDCSSHFDLVCEQMEARSEINDWLTNCWLVNWLWLAKECWFPFPWPFDDESDVCIQSRNVSSVREFFVTLC